MVSKGIRGRIAPTHRGLPKSILAISNQLVVKQYWFTVTCKKPHNCQANTLYYFQYKISVGDPGH